VTKRERAWASRANAKAMRVVGIEEGEGGKVMAMVTRVVGKRTAMATTRAMVTKTKEAGEEEGMTRAARAMAMARKAAMASNDNDNHNNGINSDQHQQQQPRRQWH
jgi:hypothetical protein